MCEWTANKGEWSEAYVFLRILADGVLNAVGANSRGSIASYPVIRIERNDRPNFRRDYMLEESLVSVVDPTNEIQLYQVNREECAELAEYLLNRIRTSTGTFSVEKVEDFLKSIDVQSIKSPGNDKRDITLIIHDAQTGTEPKLGFSIKSFLGGHPTLLNASKKTNFIYEITGDETHINDLEIETINATSGVMNRIATLRSKGLRLSYVGMESRMFELNLRMVDSRMPELVALAIKAYYEGNGSAISELVEQFSLSDPIHIRQQAEMFIKHPIYAHKFRELLTDIALGLKPGTVWDGIYDAAGGYLVIDSDGIMYCAPITNRASFQDYLVENTRFETPSTNRHNFGKVYKENDSMMINLNLQIRFK